MERNPYTDLSQEFPVGMRVVVEHEGPGVVTGAQIAQASTFALTRTKWSSQQLRSRPTPRARSVCPTCGDAGWFDDGDGESGPHPMTCSCPAGERKANEMLENERAAEQESEIAAENAWLRAAEYDPRMADPREW